MNYNLLECNFNRLILQWNKEEHTKNSYTFPISFSTKCYVVIGMVSGTPGAYYQPATWPGNETTTGFTATPINTAHTLYYIAIGS